jgi:hypothetical protein
VEPLPTGRRLLPHERWNAVVVLARQQTHSTPAIRRLQQNYGPEGIVLIAAGLASSFLASVIGIAGVVLEFVSRTKGDMGLAAYTLLAVTFCLALLGLARARQAGRAGRQFRGGRPLGSTRE